MTEPSGWLTIEELAHRSGVTTRNIRAYQSRGLLPSPVSRPGERVAFYGPEHLARLRLVSRLQDRGFSLAGIADLLRAWAEGRSLDQVLGIESAVTDLRKDESVEVSEEELLAVLPPEIDREGVFRKLVALGLVDRHDGTTRVRMPQVMELGRSAAEAGIPIDEILDEFVRVRDDLHRVALRLVSLFNAYVIEPYVEAGFPAEGLPELRERIERLRELAIEATGPLMRQALADETEVVLRERLPKPDDR